MSITVSSLVYTQLAIFFCLKIHFDFLYFIFNSYPKFNSNLPAYLQKTFIISLSH